MKTLFTLSLIAMLSLMGQRAAAQCIDSSQIDSTAACLTVYDPVCGCDSVTYSNACVAQYYGGVTSYTQGICSATLPQCCQAFFDYEVTVGIAGYTVAFNNLSTGCFVSQHWDFGNGDTSNDFEPTYTYFTNQLPPDGRAVVCLTVYNLPDSCFDQICGIVYLNDPQTCVDSSLITTNLCPMPLLVVCGCDGNQYDSSCEATNYHGITSWYMGACPANSVCAAMFDYEVTPTLIGYSVAFNNTSPTTNITYLWDFGDGNTSTSQHPTHSYNVPGNYTVCLSTTDSVTNCISTYCQVIQLHPYTCVDSFMIEPNPICPGVVDPVCGCNGVTYDNTCIAIAAGVQYWRPGACGIQQCFAYFDYAIDTATGAVTFHNLSSDTTFMLWDFGDTTSNLPNPTHIFAIPGIYPVCLTLSDGSCTATYCDTVYLDFTGTATSPTNESKLRVYPNPFSSQVHIVLDGTGTEDASLWITDLAGKRVATLAQNQQHSTYTWYAEGQPAGYYLLHYQSGNRSVVEKLLLLR